MIAMDFEKMRLVCIETLGSFRSGPACRGLQFCQQHGSRSADAARSVARRQRLAEFVARRRDALSAATAHSQLAVEFAETRHAIMHGSMNALVGDGVAEADVHAAIILRMRILVKCKCLGFAWRAGQPGLLCCVHRGSGATGDRGNLPSLRIREHFGLHASTRTSISLDG